MVGHPRESLGDNGTRAAGSSPAHWPLMETVNLMREDQVNATTDEWDLWTSNRDEWGAFYTRDGIPDEAVLRRKDTWEALSQLGNQGFRMEVWK